MSTSSLTLRLATPHDVPALAALNRAAYPDLVEEGAVFSAEQLAQHQARFAVGQIVAELGDGETAQIVGAIATLILPCAIDPLAPHSWHGVTDGGTFERHDPHGETLYLADIYVAASAWGRGVGRALYRALFELCRTLGLRRVVAGGRLYSYVDVADWMTPEAYIAAVMRDELRDRVLGSQLRAGFTVAGVLPGYLHDWRSRSYATLLVWNNPEHPQLAAARAPQPPANRPLR